jgi:hypothetical protein
MSAVSAPSYPDWKAPAEDGQILIWPEPGQIFSDTRDNVSHLSKLSHATIGRVPLNEVRRAARRGIGLDDETPLLATGHQTELYHPGVWAKDVLIDIAARTIGGRAVHFAVDTDHPKHLHLRWPGGTFPITDDSRLGSALWSGILNGPTAGHLAESRIALENASAAWGFDAAGVAVLESMARSESAKLPLSQTLMRALHELDTSLGLSQEMVLVSPLFESDAYLLLAYHILSRAEKFAADYNAALAEYRRVNKIKPPTRPMPDLEITADVCESPFWLDDLSSGGRRRAHVVRHENQWCLELDNGERFALDAEADGWAAVAQLREFLRRNNIRLSARALTLTAYFRLLLADQFVHGIGGAQYDQVTDRLIATHFGIEPPKFSVTTATLFFPTAAGRSRACLPCMAHEGHRIKNNVLGEQKKPMLEEIESLPRRSPERLRAFTRMRQMLISAQSEHPVLRNWETRYRDAVQQSAHDDILFDRELFYAIQPRGRLEFLVARYTEEMGHG